MIGLRTRVMIPSTSADTQPNPARPLVGQDEGLGLDPVVDLLLQGKALTVRQAEAMYLDAHLNEVVKLVQSPMSDEDFRRHPLIVLLMAHGSRAWEDSLA